MGQVPFFVSRFLNSMFGVSLASARTSGVPSRIWYRLLPIVVPMDDVFPVCAPLLGHLRLPWFCCPDGYNRNPPVVRPFAAVRADKFLQVSFINEV